MRKQTENIMPLSDHKAVSTKELCAMLSCGRTSAEKIGIQAGARISIGRRVLWNVSKVSDYLDQMAE